MPKTRAAHKRSASARRSYRRRVKSSHCRGKGPAACRGASGCRVASGRKRSFCRKSRNTKRHRGGMGCGKKVGGSRRHHSRRHRSRRHHSRRHRRHHSRRHRRGGVRGPMHKVMSKSAGLIGRVASKMARRN